MTDLPHDHPLRLQLNDEVHARPPEPLQAPARISYLALLTDAAAQAASGQALAALAARFDAATPSPGANHYSADLGPFRLKWERHTEFVRYTVIVAGAGDETALAAVPADWIAGLPGQLLVAAHVTLVAEDGDPVEAAMRIFPRDVLVGAAVSGGAGTVFADFRIRDSGFSRLLVQDRTLTPQQAGRMVQRLLEIDTYRMVALLALPVAQDLAPAIARCEQELAQIIAAMVVAGDPDEPLLLERLTRLAAEIDSRQASTLYRFGAAAAYYELVQRRIQDLREVRIAPLQTLQEFMERRLAPAMNTCQSVAARQEELSRRVARATQLLATRVGVTRERQNQTLLETMNRRVRLQLRLQSTVEGLSVAAVTYYIVGLIGYAAKGVEAAGLRVDPAVAMPVSIQIVAGLMAFGIGRIRHHVTQADRP